VDKDCRGYAPISTLQKNVVKEWLTKNFRHEHTRRSYRKGLNDFAHAIYGAESNYRIGIDRYFNETRDYLDDFKTFVAYLNQEGFASTTIHLRVSLVKKFFSRHERKISQENWEDIKRTLMPMHFVTTQDEVLNKEQLRDILQHLTVSGRALTLFLISTGARIGETLKLTVDDLNLESDPPQVNVRPQYTKKGVGGRVIWFSYEARDAIKEWLKDKKGKKKRGPRQGEGFSKNLVFGFTAGNFGNMWRSALTKTELEKKDPTTKILIFHVHTLRKFFSTAMSEAGVQESIIHAWMGHKGYLDSAYKRYTKEKLAQMYKDQMDAVSIYGSGSDSEFKQKLEAVEKESKQDKEELRKVDEMLDKLGISNDRSREERLLEYFRTIQTKQIPQLNKVEPSTLPKQTKSSEVSMEEPKKVEQPKSDKCLRGIRSFQWDVQCEICKLRHTADYVKCDAPQKPKGLPLKRW
jgi:Site-specific recombinase XerD